MKDGEVYKKRIIDDVLRRKLSGSGAVLVEGPKWCGKTTTCEQQAKSVLYMADPVRRDRYLTQAAVDITELLKGEQPRLIDEWQDVPKFWDAIRYDVDHSAGFGHYILTGSAVPPDDRNERSGKKDIVHSGTGRIARIRMLPMSLWESGESSGTVSLGDLFAGRPLGPGKAIERSLSDVAYLICRGGWPQIAAERRCEFRFCTQPRSNRFPVNRSAVADKQETVSQCAHGIKIFFQFHRSVSGQPFTLPECSSVYLTCPCVLYRTDNAVKRARGFAQCFQRVHRNTGQSRAVSQTFCGSHADTDPCKASGACHRGYGVQVSDLLPGRVQGCFHHRHQTGGMRIPVLCRKLTVYPVFVHHGCAAYRT